MTIPNTAKEKLARLAAVSPDGMSEKPWLWDKLGGAPAEARLLRCDNRNSSNILWENDNIKHARWLIKNKEKFKTHQEICAK